MRKTTVINQEPKQSVLPIIGGVLIAFAVADFALFHVLPLFLIFILK